MDKKIPTEEEITDLLSRVQPHPKPRFHQRMGQQPWNAERRKSFWASFTPMRTATSLGLVLLLVLGVILVSPSLDTFAQRFTQFFQPSPSSQAIADTAHLQTVQPLERFTLTIDEAEALAGFEMKIPATVPTEFRLIGASYNELREAIILHYATPSDGLVLRLSQQRLDPDYQGIGPEAVVEKVAVGPYAGEYVAGGWMIPEVESGADATKSPSEPQAVWDAHVKLQTLRWSDGEFLFEIIFAGGADQPGYLDKDGLIALANYLK